MNTHLVRGDTWDWHPAVWLQGLCPELPHEPTFPLRPLCWVTSKRKQFNKYLDPLCPDPLLLCLEVCSVNLHLPQFLLMQSLLLCSLLFFLDSNCLQPLCFSPGSRCSFFFSWGEKKVSHKSLVWEQQRPLLANAGCVNFQHPVHHALLPLPSHLSSQSP